MSSRDVKSDDSFTIHVTLSQTIAWVAVGGGAWAIVRAGAARACSR
jgi:hypothetical protein